MNLRELYEIQKRLDQRICKEHNLEDKDLVQYKILALQVELGELANETRCFKFWSKKEASPREDILEEYVDCLHFILSIGLDKGLTNINIKENNNLKDIREQFQNMFRIISAFQCEPVLNNYEKLFKNFFELGEELGFTKKEVYNAYLEKNKINHERQDQGY